MPTIFAAALFCCCCWSLGLKAQNPTGTLVPPDELVEDTSGQRDIIGIAMNITHIKVKKPPRVAGKRVYYSLIPLGRRARTSKANSTFRPPALSLCRFGL